MAGNVVNLNKVRKTKSKAVKKAKATENAIKFGRSKDAKTRDIVEAENHTSFLDGHKKDQ